MIQGTGSLLQETQETDINGSQHFREHDESQLKM